MDGPDRPGQNMIDSRKLISSYRNRFGFSQFYESTEVEDRTDLDSIRETDESASSPRRDVASSRIGGSGRPTSRLLYTRCSTMKQIEN